MKNENGYISQVVVPLAISTLLALVFAGTTVYFYSQFTDQRDNTDAKIAAAVAQAESDLTANLEADFEERLKKPYDVYTASAAYSSVAVTYPRSWSSYIVEKESGSTPISGYFHPNYVPDTRSGINYALRVELINDNYGDQVDSYQRAVDKGTIKSNSVTVNEINGVRYDGAISRNINGAVVLLPVRDKTLKVWTESTAYLADFNQALADLTFIP